MNSISNYRRKKRRWSKDKQPRQFPAPPPGKVYTQADPEFKPDWEGKCLVCGASPIIPVTGMCGPCTTGESDTAGGNW